jgi:hypothetical protein
MVTPADGNEMRIMMLCRRDPPECRPIAASIATNLCEQRGPTTTARAA